MKVFLLLLAFAQGAEPRRAEEAKVHVVQTDPDFPIEALKAPPGVVARPLSTRPAQSETIPPATRRQLLKEAGLDPHVAHWSALDQDRLMIRAEHQSAAEASARYEPPLPPEKLRALRAGIRRYRQETEKKP